MNKKIKYLLLCSILLGAFYLLYVINVGSTGKILIPPLEIPKTGGAEAEHVHFQFEAPIDQLPTTHKVYKFTRPVVTEKEAQALSTKFSINGLVQFNKKENRYIVRDGNRVIWIEVNTGKWLYQDESKVYSSLPDGDVKNIPSDGEVVAIAKRNILSLGLPLNEFKLASVIPITEENQGTHKVNLLGKNIYFYHQINGEDTAGVSRIIFTIGHNGEVESIAKYYKEVEEAGTVTLKTIEQALKELETGQGSVDIHPGATKALVKKVRVVNYEDPGSIEDQPYMQPVYIFEGDVVIGNKVEAFKATIPAVASEHIK